MVNCCAYKCSNHSEKHQEGITFHRFPKDSERRNSWIANMHVQNWVPSNNDRLCSAHFEEKWFYRTAYRRRLLHQAVPTIFTSLPSYLQRARVSKRRTRQEAIEEYKTHPGPSSLPGDTPRKAKLRKQLFAPKEHKTQPGLPSFQDDTPRKAKLRKQLCAAKLLAKMKTYKIKVLKQSVKRYKIKIVSLKAVIEALEKQNLLSDEQATLLNNMTDITKEILRRKPHSKTKYSPLLRKFAITLNFLSPKAYNYVRNTFNTCLPHSSTIGKWFKNINCEPGFTQEAIDALKRKALNSKKPLLCALIIDEMAIRRHLEWDGKRYHGYVNFGVELWDDSNALAKDAFVMLVVCINGRWKVPCGYFLTAGLSAIQKKDLVCKCISLVNETGVEIVSITFDGAQSNVSMGSMLGCKTEGPQLKTSFHFHNQQIHIFYDPPHMLKLIRNCFAEKKFFIDRCGDIIQWRFLECLNELQQNEGLHLGNKLRNAHIHFFKQKMKVRLAVQLLSASVADALQYCNEVLQLAEFNDCNATVLFIRIMNNIFDILNSRTLVAPTFKKALSVRNIEETRHFVDDAIDYIQNLKLPSGKLVIHSTKKTGFIGFIVSLNSALRLFEEQVVKKENLIYLPVYKISQDHIELFFSSIRSKGGWNNNPTARQFLAAYKRLLIRAEIREDGSGNCVPLEQVPILICSSGNNQCAPEEIINDSTAAMLDIDTEIPTNPLFQDHDYFTNMFSFTECSLQVVIYIAGFVVHYLQKCLKCEECLSALSGNKQNFLYSLIAYKSRGGLQYPSDDVIVICRKSEEFLRVAIKEGVLKKNNINLILINKVLQFYSESTIFQCLHSHALESDYNHIYFLMKAISKKYVDIRIHFITSQLSQQDDRIRNWYNKMIIFRGQ